MTDIVTLTHREFTFRGKKYTYSGTVDVTYDYKELYPATRTDPACGICVRKDRECWDVDVMYDDDECGISDRAMIEDALDVAEYDTKEEISW